jgi:hypothetical protein
MSSLTDKTSTTDMSTLLPSEWVVYLYDKQKCKHAAKKLGGKIEDAQKIVCTLKTVNDLEYFVQLMGVKLEIADNPHGPKINMDCNDIIIMRQGIKPVWEDPKNAEGGTFTAKVEYHKGYYLWSNLLMYLVGETLCDDSCDINGLEIVPQMGTDATAGTNQAQAHIIKIWDGHKNYSVDKFTKLLPKDMQTIMENESIRYSPNREKTSFGSAKVSSGSFGGGFLDGGRQGSYSGSGSRQHNGRGGSRGGRGGNGRH